MIQQAVSMLGLHRNMWMPLTALADFYAFRNRASEAETECRKALAMCEKQLPAKSPEIAICQLNLGILLAHAKKFEEAQSYFDKTQQTIGDHLSLYWTARANSAYLLAAQGKDKEAESDYVKAAQELLASRKAPRRILSDLIKNRAILMKRLGNPALAQKLYKETEEAQKQTEKNESIQTTVNYSKFMASLQRKIRKQWRPPKDLMSKQIMVCFKVGLQGELTDIQLLASSTMDAADKAALTAVEKASPVDPLPLGSEEPIDIQFTFDHNVPPGYSRF